MSDVPYRYWQEKSEPDCPPVLLITYRHYRRLPMGTTLYDVYGEPHRKGAGQLRGSGPDWVPDSRGPGFIAFGFLAQPDDPQSEYFWAPYRES